MNRSLPNVLFGGISAPTGAAAERKMEGSITKTNIEETVDTLCNAESVSTPIGHGFTRRTSDQSLFHLFVDSHYPWIWTGGRKSAVCCFGYYEDAA